MSPALVLSIESKSESKDYLNKIRFDKNGKTNRPCDFPEIAVHNIVMHSELLLYIYFNYWVFNLQVKFPSKEKERNCNLNKMFCLHLNVSLGDQGSQIEIIVQFDFKQ